jgi:hypothetical protein
VRTRKGLAGVIIETAQALMLIASNPLVSSLAADAIVVAKFSDRLRVTKVISNE